MVIFRGENIVTHEFAYGDLYQHDKQSFIMQHDNKCCEVIRETVAQSAGVKDEKGNEIYIPVFCGSAPDAEYHEGELILYQNGTRFEIGKIKRIVDDGAFVYYHEGETTAKTPFDCMRKIANSYVIKETSLGGAGNECKKS